MPGPPKNPPDGKFTATPAAPAAPLEQEPHLLRFGLRRLFAGFSAAAAFCALMTSLDAVWAIAVGTVTALVAAHVFGTLLGTRLRDTSAEVQRWKGRPGSPDKDQPVALPQPVRVAELRLPPTTVLARHQQVGKRLWFVAAGAAVGLVGGGAAVALAAAGEATWPGLAMGAVSCGVLGGWAALLGSNFYSIARQTLRQANESARDSAA